MAKTRDSAECDGAVARGLRGQLERINRLHMALKATLQPQDLVSILLACIISEKGLGFHRAFAFAYDERKDVFRGLQAMGPKTRQEHERVLSSLRAEDRRPPSRAKSLAARGDTPVEGVSPAMEEDFSRRGEGVRQHAFWIDTIQHFPSGNPLDVQTRALETPCRECQGRKNGPCLRQISEATYGGGHPRAVAACAPCLKGLLRRPAIGAALRTKKGLRAIIAADMAFGPERALPAAACSLFQWLVGQAATALENCELYSDLEAAYAQLQELETIKSNFLSVVSHELRSPLTAITGFTEVLLSDRPGETAEQRREILLRVRRQALHLAALVDDLISVAEASLAPGGRLPRESVDPLTALMNVLPLLEQRRAGKRIRIEPVVEGAVPLILANGAGLERVLFHLLDNAVKFSPNESRVEVVFRQRGASAALPPIAGAASPMGGAPAAGRLRIEVRDQGAGISQAHLKKVFETFYQVDNRLARGYEGLGIGLTLAKNLLDAMGGVIEVESRLGQGACFALEFQAAPKEGGSNGS